LWLGGFNNTIARTLLLKQYSEDIISNTSDDGLNNLIAWTSNINSNYWSADLNSVFVNNISLPNTVKRVIFDSGASLMYLPPGDYQYLMT